jgi:polyisoprenoid-binding protein YceI
MKMVKLWLARVSILLLVWLGASVSLVFGQINASNKSGSVTFSGEHAGMSFKGKFERWQASLVLPPEENPSVTANFQLKYAKTGDSTYDSTLPESDWFDVNNHPIGRFVSTEITIVPQGYQVAGNLTLKGNTNPASFLLVDKGDKLTAKFAINRLDYKIGFDSDPDAEWVGKTISLMLVVKK